MKKFVLIAGSFGCGIYKVVGPFESSEKALGHTVRYHESSVYPVQDVSDVYKSHWGAGSRIAVEYGIPGCIVNVLGPYPPDHQDDFYACCWMWTIPVTPPQETV